MPLIPTDDPQDARLDDYRNVPDQELLARRGIFVAEGRLVVRRLLTASRFAARSVMVTAAAHASLEDVLADRPDLPVYLVPQILMNGITGFNIHRGCLAIGSRPERPRWQDVTNGAKTIVALERVGNADNVGGVFRNAAAFAARAVLLDPSSSDPLYRKAIRTSMGATLHVPFARVEPWPGALHELRGMGYVLAGMTPSAACTLRDSIGQLSNRRVVLVLGHEGEGLTTAALEACDCRVRIPVSPEVDSLNVATAAAVALYALQWSNMQPH